MVPPKSSILRGFSIINHPFWGTPIFGNIHLGSPNRWVSSLYHWGIKTLHGWPWDTCRRPALLTRHRPIHEAGVGVATAQLALRKERISMDPGRETVAMIEEQETGCLEYIEHICKHLMKMIQPAQNDTRETRLSF